MARQKVQVVLPELCRKNGGEEEYPYLEVCELTGKTSDMGSCLEVKIPYPFFGRHINEHGKPGRRKRLTDERGCMFIPRQLLAPVGVH